MQCSSVPRQHQAEAPLCADGAWGALPMGGMEEERSTPGAVQGQEVTLDLLQRQWIPPECWEEEWAVHRQHFHFSFAQEDVLRFCFSEATHPM